MSSLNFVLAQVSLAITHPHKAWPEDSLSPQKSHLSSVNTFWCSRHCFVGSTFLNALHMKCFILFGHFKFQTTFQIAVILELFELPGLSSLPLRSSRYLATTLCVLLIVKMPFGDFAHTWESDGFMGLIGMLRIASTSYVLSRRHPTPFVLAQLGLPLSPHYP